MPPVTAEALAGTAAITAALFAGITKPRKAPMRSSSTATRQGERHSAMLAAVLANIALWRSPCLVAVLLLLMGAFLGLVIPANNAAVMAAVPASASAVTGGMVNAVSY